jgi:hypothetical protein
VGWAEAELLRHEAAYPTYACAPDRGSEHAVGWNWTTGAHRLGHQVWSLASTVHRAAIGRRLALAAGRRAGVGADL